MFQRGYSLDELSFLLCYPRQEKDCFEKRIVEARLLGIKHFIREGNVLLNGIPVIGKGTTAIVVKAVYLGGVEVAVKVRRLDSNRPSMRHEARILKITNKVGIGPKMTAHSRNFIIWRYVGGISLDEWASTSSKRDLEEVLAKLLVQLYILDRMGVSHKELARSRGHIIVENKNPVILDFETASLGSSKSNVTQFFSCLISGRGPGRVIRERLGVNVEELRRALASYKADMDITPVIEALHLKKLFHHFYDDVRSRLADSLYVTDEI